MPISDDKILNVFRIKLRNLSEHRARELMQKIDEVIVSKARIGKLQGNQAVLLRYGLLRDHAENIGRDFLAVFHTTVEPYYGIISGKIKIELVKHFYKRYQWAISHQEQVFKQLAASLGRSDRFNSMFNPVKGIYGESQHIYINWLEEAIEEHNLEVDARVNAETADETKEKSEQSQKGSSKNSARTGRRRRTRVELEALNPKIEEAFQDLYYQGSMTYEQVYAELGRRSKQLLGEKLTAQQIKGIHNRGKKVGNKDKYVK